MASKIANAGKHTILEEMIKRAMQEDEQALQYLDVEDSYVTPKSDLPPEWVGMKCDYKETVALYVATKKLGMQRYQSMSRNYLRCMRQLARIKFNKEFPEDKQLNRTLFQQEINEGFQDSDDDDDIIPPTPRKKKKLTSQDSDEDSTPKRPRTKKLTSQDSDEDSTPKRKRSHHSQVKCKVPGCKFHGQDIKRHLWTHVKKGEYRVKLKAAKPYSGLGEVHALVKDREESLEGKKPSEEDLPVLLSEAGEDVTKPADTSRGKDDGQKEEDNEHDVDENNDDDDEEHDEDDQDNEDDDDEDDQDNEDGEDDEYNEDDEDDDNAAKIKSQPGALEYYTATKYDDNRHQWLCGFYRYLGLPDAGYKKDALKLQHVGQVKLLLEALDKDGDDITVLGEEQGHAVWSRWGWRATVDASTQDRQVHRYIDECDAMITMKEMQQVKQSEPYTDGERYLLEASEGKKLTFEEFALVRYLLLVKFALLTGTRPAPLNNAVLGDFQTAREERGKQIILVPKHKRSKDGPAMLGMNQELQREMAIYVQKIRPHFANPDEDKIFVKDDGYGFKKGTIGRRLTEFFAKTG
ncbi:unnamed protein product, partial [Porites lobata]